MFLSRLFAGAVAAVFITTLPVRASAQTAEKTACKDGTRTSATGAHACDGHGGIHSVNSTILHRAPSKTTKPAPSEPARVSQAGMAAPVRAAKPSYEERRGWRWRRHRDEKKHEDRGRDDHHDRVRCRDGRYDKVVGKGRQVCKHHGGVAR